VSIVLDGSNLTTTGVINSGTTQNSTSGTTITFTGIPSGTKRITMMLNGVSTSGTSNWLWQLGSGSLTTSGYIGCGSRAANGGVVVNGSFTAGFGIPFDTGAAVAYGNIVFCLISSNTWSCTGMLGRAADTTIGSTYGVIALGGACDRVAITTIGGTDTFDAGSVNILYE